MKPITKILSLHLEIGTPELKCLAVFWRRGGIVTTIVYLWKGPIPVIIQKDK